MATEIPGIRPASVWPTTAGEQVCFLLCLAALPTIALMLLFPDHLTNGLGVAADAVFGLIQRLLS